MPLQRGPELSSSKIFNPAFGRAAELPPFGNQIFFRCRIIIDFARITQGMEGIKSAPSGQIFQERTLVFPERTLAGAVVSTNPTPPLFGEPLGELRCSPIVFPEPQPVSSVRR